MRATHFSTGAQHERDLAAVAMPGLLPADAMLCGGPLDAPCYLPGGAHNSTDSTDWRGRALADGALVARER